MKQTRIIFDADMLLFIALTNAEQTVEWEKDFFTTWLDMKDAIIAVDTRVRDLVDTVCHHWNDIDEYEIIMCLSSDLPYFRKNISDDYKCGRGDKRKPMCYKVMRSWLKENYNTVEYPYLEADDCCGIMATDTKDIVISGDKDFRCIPSRFYDFKRNSYFETTKEDADKFHLFQTLVGDPVDGYKGCSGVGRVTAERILEKQGYTWETVLDTYIKNGLTLDDALMNARLAYILRHNDYNEKTGEIKLWTPQK